MLNWIIEKLGSGKRLTEEQQNRLKKWRALPRKSLTTPFKSTRYVVVDVETSGLNLRRDKLISIGAIAVIDGRISLGESFYIVLQQEVASEKENILVHEIGGSAQREGVPAAEALLKFLEFLGKDSLVAFHVAFDQGMIKKAIKAYLGFNFRHSWLDLAYVMPGLHKENKKNLRTLDDWTNFFTIRNEVRHNALADAIVTAQLFLLAQQHASLKNIQNIEGLMYVEKLQHNLQRG